MGDSLRTYVAFQRSNGIASVRRGNNAFESSFQIINEAEGGMALDYLGNLYQADLIIDDEGILVGGAVQIHGPGGATHLWERSGEPQPGL